MMKVRLILLFMAMFCISSTVLAVDDLYCYWPLDGDVTDASNSPTGITGTLSGSATFVSGKIDQAIRFDGTDDQLITLGGTDIVPPWSVSLWANRAQESASSGFMQSSSFGLKLAQWDSTQNVGYTAFGVADYKFNYSAPVGQWVHLVMVGTSSGVSLYANGAFIETNAGVISCPMTQIGGTGGDVLYADLDDIAVLNRELTEMEILGIYNDGLAGTPILPGTVAISPDPSNFSVNIPVTQVLSWKTPKTYEASRYDLTYGKNSSLSGATVVSGLTETTHNPVEDFGFYITYYWRVDSYDGETKYEGSVWRFTTDGKTDNPDPADGAVRIGQDAPLIWRAVDVPDVSYDVYFRNVDANEPLAFVGNISTNSYSHPEALDPDNVYAWRVDAVCSDANTVEGDLWSYTTGGFVTDPYPADSNSVFTGTDITLSWTGDREGDTYVDGYDLYFGDTFPPPFVETVTGTSYEIPYELQDDTHYYWQVDAKHDGSVVMTSETWEFTTGQIVNHWPFDNNLDDVVGGNDAIRDNPPHFIDGFIGEAADFSSEFVNKPISAPVTAVGATANWTISLWEYSYGEGGEDPYESILGNGSDDSGWGTFEFGRYYGNRYILGFNQVYDYRATPDDSSYPREGWYFHVISHDSVARTVDWYINGALVTTYTGTNITLDPTLYVGNVSGGSQPFNGRVDELKLYSRPLSAGQALQTYIKDSGRPFNPIPATGAQDIPWDVTLQWSFVDPPTTVSIEVGKLPDLSDATPITLAPDATSFNVVTGLGVNLHPSTGYFWRITATYPDKTAVGPTWFFTVRDLLGDVSGNLVVETTDVSQMAGKWLENSYEIVPAGTEFLFVDQEAWDVTGGDPNLKDYDAYITPGGDWGTSLLSVETNPTDSNDFTPPSQTLLWTAWGEVGQQQLAGLVFLDSINFNDFDRFGFWSYQRDCSGNMQFRPIDENGNQPFTKTVLNIETNNDKWYKYEWDVGGTATANIYKVDIWVADDTFTIEYGNFFLVKDGVEVPLCFEENWFTEDVNNDCFVDVSDLAIMAEDWLLDASN